MKKTAAKKTDVKKDPAKKTTPPAKSAAKVPLKGAPKPVAKAPAKAEPKVKLDKKSAILAQKALETETSKSSEEDEDDLDVAPPTATLSAPEPSLATTTVATMKNFRNHPDIENFYRFIFENDLRLEALEIIGRPAKIAKGAKSRTH